MFKKFKNYKINFFLILKFFFIKIQKIQKEILNVAGHGQNNANIEILKEGLDGFSYFSLIFIYFAFLPESSLMSEDAHYI